MNGDVVAAAQQDHRIAKQQVNPVI